MTRAQLKRLGWTRNQIDHEIHAGRWHVPGDPDNISVVALQNAELAYDQRLWLGVLHAGKGSALSHLTAAKQAGLRWTGGEVIDVITPKGDLVPALPGFFFHQTRRPYKTWVKTPGSGPPRLAVEYAALLTAERDRSLRRAIGLVAACVQQGLTTADRLLTGAKEIRKLRHGRHFILALGDIAGGAQSFAEIDLGRLCREAGLAEPVRQVLRLDAEGRRRYLDAEWRLASGRSIVLEVDGSFHTQVDHWWRDMKRERAIVIARSSVLRCSSIEIRLDPRAIVADLRKVGVPPADGFVCAG